MSTSRILLLVSFSLVAAAFAATAALPGSGNAAAKLFSGNLCATASTSALSALQISGPCVQNRSVKVRATPLGPVRVVTYQARWGSLGSVSARISVS